MLVTYLVSKNIDAVGKISLNRQPSRSRTSAVSFTAQRCFTILPVLLLVVNLVSTSSTTQEPLLGSTSTQKPEAHGFAEETSAAVMAILSTPASEVAPAEAEAEAEAEGNLDELRRRAEERRRILGAGKSGEKHLRHELSRLGFDIGQAMRSNVRNAKQPSPPSQLANKIKVKVPCRRQPDKTLRSILGQAFNARYMAFINPGVPKENEIVDEVPSIADAFVGDQPAADDPEAMPFAVDSGYRQVLEGQIMIHHTKAERPSNVHFSRSRRDLTLTTMSNVSDTVVPEEIVDEKIVENYTMNETGKSQSELLIEKTKEKLKDLKRTKDNNDLWTCKYELRWTDLGQDHYPRYLREAVCTKKRCWFGQFECRPKAFTVKVLKRWSDSCEITNEQYLNFVSSSRGSGFYDFSSHDDHRHGDMIADNYDHDVPPELQEKWVWEEIGVNFCCECAHVHD